MMRICFVLKNCFDTCVYILLNHVKARIEVRVRLKRATLPEALLFCFVKASCKVIRKRSMGDIKTYRARVATCEVTLVLVSPINDQELLTRQTLLMLLAKELLKQLA